MQTKHTSGPWSVNYNLTTAGVAQICADKKHHLFGIADCFQGEASTHGKNGKYFLGEKEMLTNARLIAASPELLAALQSAVVYLEKNLPKGKVRDIFSQLNEFENGVLKPARAAIDKATGQA